MVKGDQCWIIENGLKVTLVEILSFSGNLVLLKTQDGKTLRIPKHRLYDSKENAMEDLMKRRPPQRKKTQYDYME